MDKSFIEQMPFPYFMIDDDYQILSSSGLASLYFSDTNLFIELITESEKKQFEDFFHLSKNQIFVELQMVGKDDQIGTFHVYKQQSKEGLWHLYCMPKEPISTEIQTILDKVKKKLIHLNGEFKENQKNFEQSVREINEAAIISEHQSTIGQLAAGIAHEIRNPLTTVKGFIQLIKPYLSELGKEDYALIALDEIDRANDILNEFLSAAKPRQNKKQLIDVNKLAREIKILYEGEAILRNLDIDIIPECENAILYLDVKQIKQVLVNILKNAIEAVEENNFKRKGIIRIRTEMVGRFATILIEDNGIGMKKETIEQLFIPFFSTKETGTGIGLTVCKKIIEEHSGSIHVSSKPFQGTSFRIELPIYQN